MPPLRCALEKGIPAGIRLGAFMVPGLALWLPSGYSWGAAWLLLLALLTWPQWRRARVAASTWALAAAMCGMACYFLAETGLQDGAALLVLDDLLGAVTQDVLLDHLQGLLRDRKSVV